MTGSSRQVLFAPQRPGATPGVTMSKFLYVLHAIFLIFVPTGSCECQKHLTHLTPSRKKLAKYIVCGNKVSIVKQFLREPQYKELIIV